MPRDEAIDPFAQLERCHRRLEEACTALAAAVETRDLETASDVASFFARQIRRHEADEEASLFPRLSKTTDATLAADVARLGEEHVLHGKLQQRLDDAVAGRVEGDMWMELRKVADELTRSYRDHIALEESRVFPAARAALGADDLAAMRAEMDARRGR